MINQTKPQNKKINRAIELLNLVRKKKEEQELAVDDSIDDAMEEVLEHKKEYTPVAASITNNELVPTNGIKKYSAQLERAIELLGKKIPAQHVCTVTGISPSYLSEMLQDDQFMGRIVALQTEQLTEATNRDKKYNKIEDLLLERLERQIPGLIDAEKTAKVLKIVNAAVRRGSGEAMGTQGIDVNNTVHLEIPQALLNLFQKTNEEIVVNDNNEIVEVSGTKLGRMDSTTLLTMAEGNQLNQLLKVEDRVVEDAELVNEDSVDGLSAEELRDLL